MQETLNCKSTHSPQVSFQVSSSVLLVRRYWLGALQVGSTGIPLATWDCSTVPDKPPHVGVGGHWTSVPTICCSTETDRSTVPSEDVWLSGVFGGKSVSLECITGQSERSRANFRHFQASFEDLLLHVILDVSHVQRIRDLLVTRYINVCFTYFYLLTAWHEFLNLITTFFLIQSKAYLAV